MHLTLTQVIVGSTPSPPAKIEVNKMILPHCDSSLLHAPGECIFCDKYPEMQEYRKYARINFSGHDDSKKAPCPSTHFRNEETINKWRGNRAYEKEEDFASLYV